MRPFYFSRQTTCALHTSVSVSQRTYCSMNQKQKKLNKFKEAAISFENALKIKPKFSEAHNNLGNVKKSLNKKDEAIY